MKLQRQDAIREVLAKSVVANQDELRRKLRRRGIEVTQATLSRDIHELRLSKGPGGYSLPNGHRGTSAAVMAAEDDSPPSVEEMVESFGIARAAGDEPGGGGNGDGRSAAVCRGAGLRGVAGGGGHGGGRRYGAGDLRGHHAGQAKWKHG